MKEWFGVLVALGSLTAHANVLVDGAVWVSSSKKY